MRHGTSVPPPPARGVATRRGPPTPVIPPGAVHGMNADIRTYVLDTNVLLHDPNSLLNFEDNNVLVPIEVIEEIDRFKRESTELGRNARTVSRMLDGFRGDGSLSEGVKLPNGGRLKIGFCKPGEAEVTQIGRAHV